MRLVVIGGGAAGFFGAVAAAENGHDVTILEANEAVLAKVRISGGGRCNVTHSCFDPKELVLAYPRGGKALRGPFSKFQPADTVEWYASRGVATKTESDGRMFPTTDDSQTIVDCLTSAAADAGVVVRTRANVEGIKKVDECFDIRLKSNETLQADRLLLATGGTRSGFELANHLGHAIVPPVPSLFTFNIRDTRINDLPGVSVETVECQLLTPTQTFKQTGPLLITHWGMSGPAVLKLSAWAARALHDTNYQATLRVNWLAKQRQDDVRQQLLALKSEHGKKLVDSIAPFDLPKRLWKSLVDHVVGSPEKRWADLSKQATQKLVSELTAGEYPITGKGVFKEEFVTCGGIELSEVDFRTMESRICSGLFFAGEILDIDGITGGFNFQNAWTTGWIAGSSMAGNSVE